MYQVLIVDDEPIVLSGIQFLIDWQANDCQITGLARNGSQALEMIYERLPDIVICDINMPAMTGLELMEECNARAWQPVFIMLSNYQEFEMARQSLQNNAVDYLLKTQIEPPLLEKSLARAKHECDKKRQLNLYSQAEKLKQVDHSAAVVHALKQLNGSQHSLAARTLSGEQVLGHYAMMQIFLDFGGLEPERFLPEDRRRVMAGALEILSSMLPRIHENSVCFALDDIDTGIGVFFWNLSPDTFVGQLRRSALRYQASLANITAARADHLLTDCLSGPEQLDRMAGQLSLLREVYYQQQDSFLFAPQLTPPVTGPRILKNQLVQLAAAIRGRDAARSCGLMDEIIQVFRSGCSSVSQDIDACAQLAEVVCAAEASDQLPELLHTLRSFVRKTELLNWLCRLQQDIVARLKPVDERDLVEEIRRYVTENVESRIRLDDVAAHVQMSPSYLSSLFKKLYGDGLVNFINEIKARHACEILRCDHCHVYELSYRMGFESPYYFARVFKRYVGMSPTEYQQKCALHEEDEP